MFKELRKRIMVFANSVDELDQSRELALAKTSLQKAMMWSGNYLKFTDSGDNPYANNGSRETVADIEPMFDKTEAAISGDNPVIVVDNLRELIDEARKEVLEFSLKRPGASEASDEIMQYFIVISIIQHLMESRMWLGMELGRMRDEAAIKA
tara:strand:+ start:12048 stop:12503 length:456 start_codon:yes stop_codon:yes gene_type:complete